MERGRAAGEQDPDSHWHGKLVSQQLTAGSHFPLGSIPEQARHIHPPHPHPRFFFFLNHSLTFTLSWRLRFAGSQDGPHAQEQLPTAQAKPGQPPGPPVPAREWTRWDSHTNVVPTYSSQRPASPGGHPTHINKGHIPKNIHSGIAAPLNSQIHSQISHPSQTLGEALFSL